MALNIRNKFFWFVPDPRILMCIWSLFAQNVFFFISTAGTHLCIHLAEDHESPLIFILFFVYLWADSAFLLSVNSKWLPTSFSLPFDPHDNLG